MAITETWLNNSILDNSPLIQLHGFQPVFRRDRSTNQQGGGVCLFVSDDVPAKRREDLEHPEMELLWVEIKPSPLRSRKSQRSLLIGCCYRQPHMPVTFYENLETVLDKAVDMDIILVGDFNAKNSEWFTGDTTNYHGSILKEKNGQF